MHSILWLLLMCVEEGEFWKLFYLGEGNKLLGESLPGGPELRENYNLHQTLQTAIHSFSEFERSGISDYECFPTCPCFGEADRNKKQWQFSQNVLSHWTLDTAWIGSMAEVGERNCGENCMDGYLQNEGGEKWIRYRGRENWGRL